ncbi:MAG: tetratricopeptide repeat protein [Acidobacteriota bacterium]
MTERIKTAVILKLAVMRGLLQGLIWGMIVCGGNLTAFAQQTTGKSLTSPGAPSAASDKAAESKRRQQAYLRFIEAQRLKGDIQRTRSRQLVEDAIKAYKDTIQLDPAAAEPHIDLGELYFFYLSQRPLAEREGQEAVRLDSNSIGGHLLLARLYVYTARLENNPRSLYLDRAILEYETVASLDPLHAEAWAFLSELYSMKNNTDKQTAALEKWAVVPVPAEQFFYQQVMNAELAPDRAYYQLSQLYLSRNKNREAIDAARQAYEANPEVGDYARNLISILRVAGTSADEIRTYSQLVKTANSPALLIGYGSALIRARRYGEAVERLREYVKLDPSNASAIGLLAMAQRRAGQRAAAVETLKSSLTKVEAGTRTDLILELAQTYEELGRNDEAIAQYEQAFEHFAGKDALTPANTPLFGEVVNRLAIVFRRLGSQTRLQTLMTRTRRLIDEHNPLVELITIEGLREDGKRREALELIRAAIRRFPDDRSLKLTEAITLSELGRYGESLELLSTMIKGRPDDATEDASIYLLMSSVHLQNNKLKESEEAARKAVTLNPDDLEGQIQLSSVLEKLGKNDAAEKGLRELLQNQPDNATALNNLGYFLLERTPRQQEALNLIEQAIAIEPVNGSFLDSLGWAHYKLGNLDKARESLEKAVVYSRRSATAHEHLGDVLQKQGHSIEAKRQWEKALEHSIEADEIARLKVKLKDVR